MNASSTTHVADATATIDHIAQGGTPEHLRRIFDTLAPVRTGEILGVWQGVEVPTGHAFSGLLQAFGWYGKRFQDAETAYPLVFRSSAGTLYELDPRRLPIGLAPYVPRSLGILARQLSWFTRLVFGTRHPKARLREIEYRGKVSAAMIYDDLPIVDVFRAVDANTLLGAMDRRGDRDPFFFLLKRANVR